MSELSTGLPATSRPAPARSTPPRPNPPRTASSGPQGLGDVLERVLDKGLVIAGDVQLNLLDIELITIKVRLLLASADTAQQMGIDWWKSDPFLNSEASSRRSQELEQENRQLQARLDRLEAALGDALPELEDEDVHTARRPPVQRSPVRRAGHPEVLERRPDDP
jgi:hypothetical protein